VGVATIPLFVAALAWIVIGIAAWHPLVATIAGWFGATDAGGITLRTMLAAVLAAVMMAVLAVATGLVAVAVLAMPVIVRTVASRDFPALAARDGGTVTGSLANAIAAVAIFIPLWLVTLPLLVVPPLYVAVSMLLNAWFIQRTFRYDALAMHASGDEIRTVLRRSRGRLFGLGLLLSPLSLVPVVNILVLPIYAGIAFAELCLAELATLRGPDSPARPA
jgi:uncharacterized protein involved in cysteine biosynthesis